MVGFGLYCSPITHSLNREQEIFGKPKRLLLSNILLPDLRLLLLLYLMQEQGCVATVHCSRKKPWPTALNIIEFFLFLYQPQLSIRLQHSKYDKRKGGGERERNLERKGKKLIILI
jgi:hypothetical protein